MVTLEYVCVYIGEAKFPPKLYESESHQCCVRRGSDTSACPSCMTSICMCILSATPDINVQGAEVCVSHVVGGVRRSGPYLSGKVHWGTAP